MYAVNFIAPEAEFLDRFAAVLPAHAAALLRLERQGRLDRHQGIIAYRARVRAIAAPLFVAYMATR